MSVDFSDERISAYLDGELTAAERAEIEALLASSLEHRQLVEELQTLRTTLQDLPRPVLASDFAERVLLRAMQATSDGSGSGSEGANGHSNAAAAPGGSTSVSELALRHSFELRWWRRAFWSISTVAAGLLGLLIISNTNHFAVVALSGRGTPTPAAPKNAMTDSSRFFRYDTTDAAPQQEFSAQGEPLPREMSLGRADQPSAADGSLALNQLESADSRVTGDRFGTAARREGGEPSKMGFESQRGNSYADPKAANGIELQRMAKEDRDESAKDPSIRDRAQEDRPAVGLKSEPRGAGNAPAPRGESTSGGAAAPGFSPSRGGLGMGGGMGGDRGGLGGMGPGGAQRKSAALPPGPPTGGLPGTPQPDLATPNKPGGSAAAAPAGQPAVADKAKATTEKAMSDEKDLARRNAAKAADPVPTNDSNTPLVRKRAAYVLQVILPSTNTSPDAVNESLKQATETREPIVRQLNKNRQTDEQLLSEQDLNAGTHVQVTPEQGQKFVDDMQRANPHGKTKLFVIADALPVNREKKDAAGQNDAKEKLADQVDGVPITQPLNSNRKNFGRYALPVPDNRLSRQSAEVDPGINVLPKLAAIDAEKGKGLRALAELKVDRLKRRETEDENVQEEMIDIILVVDTQSTSRDVPTPVSPTPAKPVAPPTEPK